MGSGTYMAQRLFIILLTFLTVGSIAKAQELSWIQIEAHSSLLQAEERAQTYAQNFPNVAAFSLGSGWYAISLGPYADGDTSRGEMTALKRDRQVPSDAFVSDGRNYRQQIWPIGAQAIDREPTTALRSTTEATVVENTTPATPEPAAIQQPDETKAEALRSESLLDREERKAIQIALRWSGVYNGAIDGAFGRGTRGSMAQWQAANNHEETGVLTTAQRAELFAQYNAVLTEMQLENVVDSQTGIAIMVPSARVAFEGYHPPFAHYTAKEGRYQLSTISQQGNSVTLGALYEVLQTLAIMPEEGPRKLGSESFEITGQNDDIITYATASLKNGEVKGFVLVWPTNEEEARTRLLDEINNSFEWLNGTLDPMAGNGAAQDIDLAYGMDIRRPKISGSGFFVSSNGHILTSSSLVNECASLSVDNDIEASVVAQDAATGWAILKPSESIAPLGVASFTANSPRLRDEIALAGYSYGGRLGSPSVTYGGIEELVGLNKEPHLARLTAETTGGDIGGPVLNMQGEVVGMIGTPQTTKQLPSGTVLAVSGPTLTDALKGNGLSILTKTSPTTLDPEDLVPAAADITTLVNCW